MRAMQRRLSQLHPDKYHLVELDGFVCLDDKQAIREIWRQLGREMDADEDIINKPTTLADMMQTLLATLSHPSEMGIDGDNVTSKAVIFIINEANFFAEHHRQTLLYNLFDIAQSRKAPIFVICVTTRIDFASDLEKRVRSRFGHRFTWVRPAANLDEYTEQCRDSLVIDKNDLADEGINTNLEGFDEFHKFWDHKVDTLFKTKAFQALLRQHFWENRTLPPFLLSCRMMLLNMQLEGSDLTLQPPTLDETTASSRGRKSFAASIAATSTDKQALADAHGPDSKLSLLPSLSDLGLSLLVAAARLEPFAGAELVNLGMAYDEYASLVSRQRTQSVATTGGMSSPLVAAGAAARLWSKRRAAAEWEHLVNLGLLIPAGPSGGASIRRGPRATGAQGAAGLDAKMFRVDLRLEEIPDAVVGIAAHLVKWCRAP